MSFGPYFRAKLCIPEISTAILQSTPHGTERSNLTIFSWLRYGTGANG